MKVLLDVGISPRLRPALQEALGGTIVESAIFHDWHTLRNSELLDIAHRHGFTALVTSDKRLALEQTRLPIAVIAVDDNRLGPLRASVHDIALAIRETPAGGHRIVAVDTKQSSSSGAPSPTGST